MPDEDEVKKVLDAHAERIAALPHVVGLGIARTGDDAAIAVYVDTVPSDGARQIPAALATTVDGACIEVPTEIVPIGTIDP